ncbi:hypothetical protein BDW74DRAFT_168558 [Aspergillus multicolor]|uniref:FAD-binding oxidoreductase n=1 Tax=Aspergillus multicolor TaxID=41759 RepID=UPI003CCDCF68
MVSLSNLWRPEVSLAVSILSTFDDGSDQCHFGIRGGGIMPWKGAASVEGGVTIDLTLLNGIVYDEESSSMSILGGTRWGDVYQTLEPLGFAVAGGRADTVGVAGLVIGGGLSYFANQYGLACDNVLDFEVVLANGAIVNANRNRNTDLFRALKGGGNNFGIMTKVIVRAFKQGPLWGGLIGHSASTVPAQSNALLNFTSNLVNDGHAQLVTIWQHNGKSNTSFAASGLQYTLGTENAPIFEDFLDLPRTFSSLRVTDIYDLMMETAPPPGRRAIFLTLTVKNNLRVLEYIHALHNKAHVAVRGAGVQSEDWDVIIFMQPFPALLANASQEPGNANVLGLERMSGQDHLVFMLFLDWQDEADDALFYDLGYGVIDKVKAYTQDIGVDSDYIYMNYAGRDQNPLRGYGDENLEFLRAVARKYDPFGVFQRQVPGGFKISKA